MNLFLVAVIAVSSVGALVLSAFRFYLEWKRHKNIAWETTVRLMVSDPDARIRADDFADLYTKLCYLETHPDCLANARSLTHAMDQAKQPSKR